MSHYLTKYLLIMKKLSNFKTKEIVSSKNVKGGSNPVISIIVNTTIGDKPEATLDAVANPEISI